MSIRFRDHFELGNCSVRGLAVAGVSLALFLVACGGGGGDGGVPLVDGQAEAVGTPVPFEPTPTTDPGPTQLDMTTFEVGGQSHQIDPSVVALLDQSNMNWVKFQHKWEPGAAGSDVAGRIIDAHSAGYKVLLSVPGPPFPQSIDYEAYINFLTEAATYQPDAIEIWNEENLDREWPATELGASSYVLNMLQPAYERIKSVNDNIMIISGALAPTGAFASCPGDVGGVMGCNDDAYIADMVAAGAENYLDCVGIHYNAGATAPSATSGHPYDQGVATYQWYYPAMVDLYTGTFSKPLCFTELGYLTSEGYDPLPQNFDFATDNTVQEQAQWLGENVQMARDSGRVRMVVVYNLDFDYYGPDDPQAGYAILRPDGSCPACDTIAQVVQ